MQGDSCWPQGYQALELKTNQQSSQPWSTGLPPGPAGLPTWLLLCHLPLCFFMSTQTTGMPSSGESCLSRNPKAWHRLVTGLLSGSTLRKSEIRWELCGAGQPTPHPWRWSCFQNRIGFYEILGGLIFVYFLKLYLDKVGLAMICSPWTGANGQQNDFRWIKFLHNSQIIHIFRCEFQIQSLLLLLWFWKSCQVDVLTF